jgi:hypothetical protein
VVNNVRYAIIAATGLGDEKTKCLSASLLNKSFERATDKAHDAEHVSNIHMSKDPVSSDCWCCRN